MQILVPMDYSELSEKALRTTCSLHPDAEITVLHVIDFRTSDLGPGGWGESPSTWADWLADARERAAGLLERAEAIAAEYDVEITTATTVGEDARSILEYVDEHGIDIVVMGGHSRSLPARVLLGGTAETVVRRAGVPVMVVR